MYYVSTQQNIIRMIASDNVIVTTKLAHKRVSEVGYITLDNVPYLSPR